MLRLQLAGRPPGGRRRRRRRRRRHRRRHRRCCRPGMRCAWRSRFLRRRKGSHYHRRRRRCPGLRRAWRPGFLRHKSVAVSLEDLAAQVALQRFCGNVGEACVAAAPRLGSRRYCSPRHPTHMNPCTLIYTTFYHMTWRALSIAPNVIQRIITLASLFIRRSII